MTVPFSAENFGSRPRSGLVPPTPAEILSGAQSGRPVVQDFRPLAESLEWGLGQRYLQERGSKAFLSDPEPVPWAVNNDGSLSENAAEVLFSALCAAERAGKLERDIYVLELGIGVGLFARYFLDHFRDVCARAGKDYYGRLTYVAADYSQRMLDDACRRGTFADHPGRYLLRVVDAMSPEEGVGRCPVLSEPGRPPFRAVFLNYLLDCLPAAVLRRDEDRTKQLCVRTCLTRAARPGETPFTLEELRRLAASNDPADRSALQEAASLLVAEYDYRPADVGTIPHGQFAVDEAAAAGQRLVVHNHGAIRCLERLLGLLGEGGLILLNDYGQVKPDEAEDFAHQRYSGATFVGVNFPLLQAYFTRPGTWTWAKPEDEEGISVHPRLLGKRVAPEAVARFKERFGKEARDWREAPLKRAREWTKHGRLEAALLAYQEGLERQPGNWALMTEVAHLLTFGLGAPLAGAEMARAGLARNPACSAELWNVLGDSLFNLGRVEESFLCFKRALRVNAQDVRAHYNLVFVYLRTGQQAQALRAIADALVLDREGAYRQDLLTKQQEVLTQLEHGRLRRHRLLADRIISPRPPVAWERALQQIPAPGLGGAMGSTPFSA